MQHGIFLPFWWPSAFSVAATYKPRAQTNDICSNCLAEPLDISGQDDDGRHIFRPRPVKSIRSSSSMWVIQLLQEQQERERQVNACINDFPSPAAPAGGWPYTKTLSRVTKWWTTNTGTYNHFFFFSFVFFIYSRSGSYNRLDDLNTHAACRSSISSLFVQTKKKKKKTGRDFNEWMKLLIGNPKRLLAKLVFFSFLTGGRNDATV